jgi:hypothetical protein
MHKIKNTIDQFFLLKPYTKILNKKILEKEIQKHIMKIINQDQVAFIKNMFQCVEIKTLKKLKSGKNTIIIEIVFKYRLYNEINNLPLSFTLRTV